MSFRVPTLALVGVLAIAPGTVARAQSRINAASHATMPADDSTRVTLALAVGNRRLSEAKMGRCVHAPMAAIYSTRAAMWMVDYRSAPGRSVSLTIWRPMSGDTTPQMNLGVSDGGKSERIATVRAAEKVGKGVVQVTKHGAGGRFEISGTTGNGSEVRGYIECAKFSAPAPVGGN